MLLIYSHINNRRLEYTLNLIFGELLGLPFSLTDRQDEFMKYQGPAVVYAPEKLKQDAYHVSSSGLLSEKGLRPERPAVVHLPMFPVVFRNETGDHPFDIFSAVFYLVSRYEEYLPYKPDQYERFPHEESIAFRERFLHLPLVNIWVQDLAVSLQKRFPELIIREARFYFKPTYDIDIAWSYQHKGFWRNLGGFIRKPGIERLQVLAGLKPDPYNSYALMDALHDRHQLSPIYFFLFSFNRNRYDKNISTQNPAFRELIKAHAQRYDTGLHPSWETHIRPEALHEELGALQKLSGKPVKKSRQHYIRFQLPGTYRGLSLAGITDDYSMGYGSINGFRASIASSFLWYDLEREEITQLRVHPFCFMDANSFFEQKQDADTSFEELMYYYDQCRLVNGTMISIFHNQFLGNDRMFMGWPDMYARFLMETQR